jgi:galactokinase
MASAYNRALAAYRQHFGKEPTVVVRAPGRVNLIGEHTDYNDGFVFPCAIDRDTVVAAGPSADRDIHVIADDFNAAEDIFTPSPDIMRAPAEWANYVRGMAKMLIMDGVPLRGARLAIAGDVPLGSGLSSSASLEIAVGRAFTELAGHTLDPTHMAQIAQRAENKFVGCACGIMDQLIATRGVEGHALLIDCRSLECRPILLPHNIAVIIAHSGVRHAHAGGEYNDRRAQCERAAQHYNVAALRDLSLDVLETHKAGLDDIAYRRARHVVSENARTQMAATALQNNDLKLLGHLMAQSHASMRDDFEITVPAVDRLAEIMAEPLAGEGGARMTGGGFGGCVIAVAPQNYVASVLEAIAHNYRTPNNEAADVFVCRATAGASMLPLP